jgi:tetratricopeptide (TPR) repeat protein
MVYSPANRVIRGASGSELHYSILQFFRSLSDSLLDIILIVFVSNNSGEVSMDVEQLAANTLDLYKTNDSFAAIMYLCNLADPKMTMNTLADVMRHQYWKEKDLVGALAFARAGIQFGLQSALRLEQSNPELALELRRAAKGFAYNFASFAWAGWDEPGVVITSADHAAGFDAARLNLRLAIELERGDLPASRAYWLVGAYQLADGKYNQAVSSFEEGIKFAKQADATVDELLNHGYILVTKMLATPDDTSIPVAYENLKTAFQQVEHGGDFVQQLDTAYQVFSKSSPHHHED